MSTRMVCTRLLLLLANGSSRVVARDESGSQVQARGKAQYKAQKATIPSTEPNNNNTPHDQPPIVYAVRMRPFRKQCDECIKACKEGLIWIATLASRAAECDRHRTI